MKLYFSPDSPASRKVLVLAHEVGLEGRIQPVVAGADNPEEASAASPRLGQSPVLVRDDGSALTGAAPICEYLDTLHERPNLMPDKGEARLEIQQLESVATDLLDAAVAHYREIARPVTLRWEGEAERQKWRAARLLDRLDGLSGSVLAGPVTLGQISVACVLAWIDEHLPDEGWRHGRDGLARWYDSFRDRPSMRATGRSTISAP